MILGLLHALTWVLIAPLLPGIINRVKARVAGRRGPPLLQGYYDLRRLGRKGVVMSSLASPAFLAAPAIAWVALCGAVLLVPFGPLSAGIAFRGDALVLVYLLALARFCTAWAAMETGSAFEGMGTVREVSYAVLSEVGLLAALLSLGLRNGSASLTDMLAPAQGPGTALLAGGLFVLLLAENGRVPFDDPNTHLELTMVHEAMVLDHSGPPLAVILHGASMKLLLFTVVLASAVLPLAELPPLLSGLALVGGVVLVTVCVGLVESLTARLAFARVPLLLVIGFLLCLFSLVIAWKGRGA